LPAVLDFLAGCVLFPAGELPPVNGFWSLTLYNEFHFYNPNPLGRYSPGTKNKTLQFNDDGSLTLYAGAASSGPDHEPNWLPAPGPVLALHPRLLGHTTDGFRWREHSYGGFGGEHPPFHLGKVRCGVTGHP
jgi:hypothetical protein